MGAILEQLEINQTFFYELAIFAVVYLLLSAIFFRPFLRLFEHRHQKTVTDRQAAESLMAQANAKFEEYRARLAEERKAARADYEAIIADAKKEENNLIAHARTEAKRVTQEAVESVTRQREQLKAELQGDVENLAKAISEKLLSRKV